MHKLYHLELLLSVYLTAYWYCNSQNTNCSQLMPHTVSLPLVWIYNIIEAFYILILIIQFNVSEAAG